MKKLTVYAVLVLSLASCGRSEYSFTQNDITTTGRVHTSHHIEIISLPKADTTRHSSIAYR